MDDGTEEISSKFGVNEISRWIFCVATVRRFFKQQFFSFTLHDVIGQKKLNFSNLRPIFEHQIRSEFLETGNFRVHLEYRTVHFEIDPSVLFLLQQFERKFKLFSYKAPDFDEN